MADEPIVDPPVSPTLFGKVRAFLGKIPWQGWLIVVIAILFFFNLASGAAYSKKIWTMLKDQITTEEKRIIEDLKRDKGKLAQDNYTLEKQVSKIRKQKEELAQEVKRLEGKLTDVQAQLDNLIIPTDPNVIIRDLERYLGPVRRIRK